MSEIFIFMSIGFMSHVDFKKCPCRPVDVKGQGPYEKRCRGGAIQDTLSDGTGPKAALTQTGSSANLTRMNGARQPLHVESIFLSSEVLTKKTHLSENLIAWHRKQRQTKRLKHISDY